MGNRTHLAQMYTSKPSHTFNVSIFRLIELLRFDKLSANLVSLQREYPGPIDLYIISKHRMPSVQNNGYM